MTPFGEHERDRIKRVLREQLSPAEDDGDEADGIQEVGDKFGDWTLPQLGDHDRRAQGGQAHGDSTGQSGDAKPQR